MIGVIRNSGFQLANDVVDFLRVMARVDAVGGMPDHALLVDHEGGAHQALASHAVYFLFLQHAVTAADFALGVGQQADRQAVLVAEIRACQAVTARTPRTTQLQRSNSLS